MANHTERLKTAGLRPTNRVSKEGEPLTHVLQALLRISAAKAAAIVRASDLPDDGARLPSRGKGRLPTGDVRGWRLQHQVQARTAHAFASGLALATERSPRSAAQKLQQRCEWRCWCHLMHHKQSCTMQPEYFNRICTLAQDHLRLYAQSHLSSFSLTICCTCSLTCSFLRCFCSTAPCMMIDTMLVHRFDPTP